MGSLSSSSFTAPYAAAPPAQARLGVGPDVFHRLRAPEGDDHGVGAPHQQAVHVVLGAAQPLVVAAPVQLHGGSQRRDGALGLPGGQIGAWGGTGG